MSRSQPQSSTSGPSRRRSSAPTPAQPVLSVQALDGSTRSSHSNRVDQRVQEPSTADRPSPAEARQIPPRLQLPPPSSSREDLYAFVQQLFRDYAWLYQVIMQVGRNPCLHPGLPTSAVQATAATTVPAAMSVSEATAPSAMPQSSACAAPAPLPTSVKRSMPYTRITSKFMKAMKEKKGLGRNESWRSVTADPGDEDMIQEVFNNLKEQDRDVAALSRSLPGGSRMCLKKCRESYRRQVPLNRHIIEPIIAPESANIGQPAERAQPRRSSRYPSLASKRRKAARSKRKGDKLKRALTPAMLAKYPGLSEAVLEAMVSSEYTTDPELEDRDEDVEVPNAEHRSAEAPAASTSRDEPRLEQVPPPNTSQMQRQGPPHRRVHKSWMSAQACSMRDEVKRVSQERRKERKDAGLRLEPFDVVLRPSSGTFREGPSPLPSFIQRQWVSMTFKTSFEEAVVDVRPNEPPLDPDEWGTTPAHVTVRDSENEADDEEDSQDDDDEDDIEAPQDVLGL